MGLFWNNKMVVPVNCTAGRGKKIHRRTGAGTACGLDFQGHHAYKVVPMGTELTCVKCIKVVTRKEIQTNTMEG